MQTQHTHGMAGSKGKKKREKEIKRERRRKIPSDGLLPKWLQ